MTKKQDLIARFLDEYQSRWKVPDAPIEGFDLLEHGLVLVLNDHLTPNQSEATVKALRAADQDWNELRVSQSQEIAQYVRTSSRKSGTELLFEKKPVALAIKDYLQDVFQQTHGLTLEFLREDVAEHSKLLSDFKVLGMTGGSYVFWLAADGRVPVHLGLVKILEKLGFCGKTTSIKKAQEMITERQGRHQKDMRRLLADQQVELSRSDAAYKARMTDLRDEQEEELKAMKAEHASEIDFMIHQQAADLQREQQVQEAETVMLRESRKLQSVLDTVVDAIITMSPDGTILVFNPAAAGMFGFSASEIVGQNISMMLPPEHKNTHHKYVDRYLRTGVAHIIGRMRRLEAMRRDGTRFMVDLSLSEVKATGYHIFTGILRDITDQIRKEHEIKLEKEKLTAVMSSINDCVITSRVDGIITSFNSAAERQFGYHRNEVLGKNVRILMADEIAVNHSKFIDNYLTTGVAKVIGGSRHVKAKKKNGEFFDCLLSLSEVRGEGFRIFTAIIRDTTEELRAQAAIAMQGEQLSAIRNCLVDAVVMITPDGKIQTFNDAATKLLGYAPAEVVGKDVSVLCPPEHKVNHPRYVKRYLDTGEKRVVGSSRFVNAMHKDGKQVPVKLSLCEARGEGFQVFTAVLQDLTEEKQRERDLQTAQEATKGIIDTTVDPFFTCDEQGVIATANAAVIKSLQISPADAVGKSLSIFFTKEDQPRLSKLLATAAAVAREGGGAKAAAAKKEANVEGHQLFHGHTFKKRPVMLDVTAKCMVHEGVITTVVTMVDVTDDFAEKQATTLKVKQLDVALNLVPDLVICTDQAFNVTVFNQTAIKVLGCSADVLREKNMIEILPNSDRRSAVPNMPVIGDPKGITAPVVLHNGTKVHMQVLVYQTSMDEDDVEELLTWTLRKK